MTRRFGNTVFLRSVSALAMDILIRFEESNLIKTQITFKKETGFPFLISLTNAASVNMPNVHRFAVLLRNVDPLLSSSWT